MRHGLDRGHVEAMRLEPALAQVGQDAGDVLGHDAPLTHRIQHVDLKLVAVERPRLPRLPVEDPDAGPLLFSGDTLFRRSIGRTDLPGGDGAELARSIKQRLYGRDPRTLVIPGHGPLTTLGEEARDNPFVRR